MSEELMMSGHCQADMMLSWLHDMIEYLNEDGGARINGERMKGRDSMGIGWGVRFNGDRMGGEYNGERMMG